MAAPVNSFTPKKKKTPKSPRLRQAGTYFRTAYYTHLDLSRMADHKAHLLISVNMLVLSLVVTKKHLGFLAHHHRFFLPNLLLVVVCLTSIVLAVRVTRPGLPKQRRGEAPSAPAIADPNWLFFGDYSRYPLEVYHENIQRLVQDEPALYDAMSRDLHQLGVVLGRKYRLLTRCYQFFFYGLLLLVTAYAGALAWH